MLSIKSPLCLSATGALPAEGWPAGGGSTWSRCNSSEMQIQIGQIHTKYKLYKYKFKLKYKTNMNGNTNCTNTNTALVLASAGHVAAHINYDFIMLRR